jgi:hypothetical protein
LKVADFNVKLTLKNPVLPVLRGNDSGCGIEIYRIPGVIDSGYDVLQK